MVTHAEYLQLPGVNWSRLKHARESMARYRYECDNASADTTTLAVGRAVHSIVFEPEKFHDAYAVWHKDRKGNEWAEFKAENAGRTILKTNEFEHGLLMRTWHRLAILCRRLQIRAVHVRLRQLELLACSQLLRVRRGHAVDSLQYARVLCRQSELRLHLKQLHALLAEHLAALQAPRSAPSTADDLGAC